MLGVEKRRKERRVTPRKMKATTSSTDPKSRHQSLVGRRSTHFVCLAPRLFVFRLKAPTVDKPHKWAVGVAPHPSPSQPKSWLGLVLTRQVYYGPSSSCSHSFNVAVGFRMMSVLMSE